MYRVFRERELRSGFDWRQGDKKWRAFVHFGKGSGREFVPDAWFGGMPIKQAVFGLEKCVRALERHVPGFGIII